jgi:hypothetical protein
MSLSAVTMATRQSPVNAIAMKMTLMNTTKRLAAILAGLNTNRPRLEGLEYRRRQHVPLPADPSRLPAYLREAREIGAIYPAVIGSFSVAMTAVKVAALIEDRAKVEIAVTAVVPD